MNNMYLNATFPNWDEVCAENMVNSMELAMFIAQSVGLTVAEPQEETAKEMEKETGKENNSAKEMQKEHAEETEDDLEDFPIYHRQARRKATFSNHHHREQVKRAKRKAKRNSEKHLDKIPGWMYYLNYKGDIVASDSYAKHGTVQAMRTEEKAKSHFLWAKEIGIL